MTDRELLDLAKNAAEHSYSPYSNFPVGAAIECKSNIVFTGCNVENASYGLAICAERTAAVKAVSAGHRDVLRIAIYNAGDNYCLPCGACRQFLSEFGDNIEFLCARGDGRYVSYKISELLPHSFKL